MPVYQTFTNAPISEAVLDIRVTLPGEPDFSVLEPFCDEISVEYPNRRFRKEWKAGFSVSGEGEPVTSSQGGVIGYLLTSSDGSFVAQARVNGFSLSRLRPYQNWPSLRAEAERLWEVYQRIADPKSIERIAVRYINRLDLPLPLSDFREYVLTAPEIAPGLPQALSQFLMQLVIPSPEHEATAVVTETIDAPTGDAAVLPFILDIDVSRVGGLSPRDELLWDRFERLRDFKNEIFFKTITEKTKELFK